MINPKNKGFTLIELLVVIAIIALLSAVVLASLATARLKSQDSAVRQAANQMRTLLEQNRLNNATYAQLEPQKWFQQSSDCDTGFSGTYMNNMIALCKSAVKNTNVGPNGYGMLWIGTAVNKPTLYFSIMAYLPQKGAYYCVGSNGTQSDVDLTGFTSAGCSSDPFFQ